MKPHVETRVPQPPWARAPRAQEPPRPLRERVWTIRGQPASARPPGAKWPEPPPVLLTGTRLALSRVLSQFQSWARRPAEAPLKACASSVAPAVWHWQTDQRWVSRMPVQACERSRQPAPASAQGPPLVGVSSPKVLAAARLGAARHARLSGPGFEPFPPYALPEAAAATAPAKEACSR